MAETAPTETSPPGWRRKSPYHNTIIISLFAAVTIALVVVFFYPEGGTLVRGDPKLDGCAANVNKLWIAMTHYAAANGGRFPDRIEQLLPVDDLSLSDFVCPASKTERPAKPGDTAAATAKNLVTGKHLSYVYVAQRMKFPPPGNVVIMYEPSGHHLTADGVALGGHVLFGDGHIKFVRKADIEKIIKELKAGQNPPPTASGY